MRRFIDFALPFGAGTALWLAAAAIDRVREPWDGAHFWWFYAVALLLSALCGLVAARHAWSLGVVVIFAMSPVMLVGSGIGPLAAIGLAMLALLSLPAAGIAQMTFGLKRLLSAPPS